MKLFQIAKRSPLSSPEAFREIYEDNKTPVFRYVYSLVNGSQQDAEDLTAETFLRAWRARHRFEGEPSGAIGWLIGIAKNLVVDDYRRRSRAVEPFPGASPEDAPEQYAIVEEEKRQLIGVLGELPDEQREILILRYVLGWQVMAIAAHLELTPNHVSVIIHRALSGLRARWEELDQAERALPVLNKEKPNATRS